MTDLCLFYYNYHDIEQQKLHHLLLYIKSVSVFCEHIVLDHGVATTFNRECLGIFCFLLFIIILFIPVHEIHKHFLVWDHVVSPQEASTALNRE